MKLRSFALLVLVSATSSACHRDRSESASSRSRPPAESAGSPSRPPSQPAEPGDPYQQLSDEINSIPPPPPSMRCNDMNAQQCMLSRHCVLHEPEHGIGLYTCREAVGRCETNLPQADPNFEARCSARSGCEFHEGSCTCGPQTRVTLRLRSPQPECFCAGGPPRKCEPAQHTPTPPASEPDPDDPF